MKLRKHVSVHIDFRGILCKVDYIGLTWVTFQQNVCIKEIQRFDLMSDEVTNKTFLICYWMFTSLLFCDCFN